jgi:RND superfamily putative drug exporter
VVFGGVDHRALPAGTESRVVSEDPAERLPGGSRTTIDAVVTADEGALEPAALSSYVEKLRALAGCDGSPT